MRVAIIGSAHLDILSTVSSHAETLDKPGELSIAYGGTGHNIALNLAALGHEVIFLTAMSASLISRSIVEAMRMEGVSRVLVDTRDDLPEAGFSAHIVGDDLISAVSSMPVGSVRLRPELLKQACAGVDAVIAECNLTVETLQDVGALCAEQGVPLYVAAVSEAKALKLSLTGPIATAAFLNEREMAYLVAQIGFDDGAALAAFLGCTLVETRSEKGLRIWPHDAATPMSFTPRRACARRRPGDHWLGAGDHLLAMTLHKHHASGISFALAAIGASRYVTARHGRKACHLGAENPLEDKLRSLMDKAHRDRLTGLLNRSGLEQVMEGLPQDTPISLVMIDIDHFKLVNDRHGHDAGDRILESIAQILVDGVRETDAVARWGGEEMVIILPHADLEDAVRIADRIRLAVEVAPLSPPVTISMGVAHGRSGSISELREMADQRLYEAKRRGRNRVVAHAEAISGDTAA